MYLKQMTIALKSFYLFFLYFMLNHQSLVLNSKDIISPLFRDEKQAESKRLGEKVQQQQKHSFLC